MPRSLNTSLMAAAVLALVPWPALSQDSATKQLVEGMCASCHRFTLATNSMGYTADGWKQLIGTMVDLSADESMLRSVTQYLAKALPPNTRRAAKIVPGPVQVSFKEWQPPTLGQRARDPAEAPDGTIWWAGEFANLIGSLNPATGEMKEYPLPRGASPHAVDIDGKGNVWYAGTKNGTIGALDPKTGKTTVFKTGKAGDPHSLAFDSNGLVWFTAQAANMVGRLDPASGDVKLVALKTPNAKPYGIKIDSSGTIWVACAGAPCLARIDPASLAVAEIKLPQEGTTVRRLAIAGDGTVWFVNTGKGRIGRYDPKNGEIKEWPTPSGPRSLPYGIAVADGAVWFNESGMRPDPLVRFDPKTETFQSWPIPSGGIQAGSAQSIRVTSDGGLLLSQSSTSRIVKATTARGAASR
jgi:virginiamycin B lyase